MKFCSAIKYDEILATNVINNVLCGKLSISPPKWWILDGVCLDVRFLFGEIIFLFSIFFFLLLMYLFKKPGIPGREVGLP